MMLNKYRDGREIQFTGKVQNLGVDYSNAVQNTVESYQTVVSVLYVLYTQGKTLKAPCIDGMSGNGFFRVFAPRRIQIRKHKLIKKYMFMSSTNHKILYMKRYTYIISRCFSLTFIVNVPFDFIVQSRLHTQGHVV